MAGSLQNPIVFEVDNYDRASKTGWSVVVRARFREVLPTRPGVAAVTGWTGPKDFELSIPTTDISGRRVDARLWAGAC